MIPPIASNFIAGKNNQDVKDTGKLLYSQKGIKPIANRLGEHYTDEHDIRTTKTQYIELIDKFSNSPVKYEISVKPTQLGSEKGYNELYNNLDYIVKKASENDIFVWIDMEDEDHIVKTIKSYHQIALDYPRSAGICLQANLKRTKEDIRIIGRIDGSSVRIVKGAYSSYDSETFETKDKIDDNMKQIIDYATNVIDHRVAIGSHDKEIIEDYTGDSYNDKIEFQMLKGVREDYQEELSDDYDVLQYMPYGEEWISYTYRRIRERPRNIFLIARNLF
jgi:proline dehydrogenase